MAAKLMTSRTHSATSPYSEDDGIAIPKGWSSERVPLSGHRRCGRRHVPPAALMPFGSGSGRAFPSKWDDAERWISSPATAPNNYYYATGVAKASQLGYNYQRRAKSKSGPLGPARLMSYGSFNGLSPVLGMGVIHGGRWRNSVAVESPAAVRARFNEGMGGEGGGGASEGGRRSCPGHVDPDPDWLDLWSGPPSPDPHQVNQTDEHTESLESNQVDDPYSDEQNEATVDRVISRRDMATQMYPEPESSPSSMVSSPRSSISDNSPVQLLNDDLHPSGLSNNNGNNVRSPEYYCQVRDVQVDKQTSSSRRSTSERDRGRGRGREREREREQVRDIPGLSPAFTEADNRFSKLEKEEARITTWENLQKAKAEAAVQKLEMKLEKKRATAMEKIIEKLRRAELKAEKMRSTLSNGSNDDQSQSRTHVSKTSVKIPSFCRKIKLTSSTKHCTTCYPF